MSHEIKGIQVFSAGEWNGDPYTIDDLGLMVQAFDENKAGMRPFIKLGHDKDQKLLQADGLPSGGWVDKLYVSGDKLMADVVDIPKKVYELIKKKAYRKVSSEIFWNVKIGEKKYKRMLAAVALLGADAPGVMNLSDILAMYTNSEADELKIYEQNALEITTKEHSFETLKEETVGKTESELKLEIDLQAEKAKAEALETEKKTFVADLKAKDDEVAELKKYKETAETEKKELMEKAEKAETEKFLTDLQSEKLITPAMKQFVLELVGPEKKTYSIKTGDKETAHSKKELLKETLKLFRAAKDVNFEESSTKVYKGAAGEEEMDAKAKKYAEENKCSYGSALKAVMAQSKQKEK